MNEELRKLLDEINKKNALLYGDMQKCCGFFKNYCRCEILKTKNLKNL